MWARAASSATSRSAAASSARRGRGRLAWGAEPRGVVDSGLPGPKGNRETFSPPRPDRPSPRLPDDFDEPDRRRSQLTPSAARRSCCTASATTARRPRVERLERVAGASRRRARSSGDDAPSADLAVVLGGDGTMLRALDAVPRHRRPRHRRQLRPRRLPRVDPCRRARDRPAPRIRRRLRTSSSCRRSRRDVDGQRTVAVNDVVVHSATLGRMVELAWEVGGEDFGTLACDGVICSTPSGSTAYNLSNGGPVLAWGLDAMAVTFIAPHSLARAPARGRARRPTSSSATGRGDVLASVLVDGHLGRARSATGPASFASARPTQRSLPRDARPRPLFFRRYPRDLCFVGSASRTSS